MSDLGSIGNHKRAPLPGSRPAPFRADPSIDRLLKRPDSVDRMLQRKPGAGAGPREDPLADLSLVSSLTSRLAEVEKQLSQSRKEIALRDDTIRTLNATIKDLRLQTTKIDDDEIQSLRLEYKRMQKKVHDMETFLADYGMVWIGDTEGNEDTPQEPEPSSAPAAKMWAPDAAIPQEFKVDFDAIVRNVAELNVLAGEGIAKIEAKDGARRLLMPDPVPLHLYQDGLLMFAGPFRPFTDETTQACVRDLVEGYFPWELKERFPNGTPFKLIDRRTETYKQSAVKAFTGAGYQLGGPSDEAQRDAFLRRLPAAVVREGRIVDVRAGIAEALRGDGVKKPSCVVASTPVVESMAASADSPQRPATPGDVATLQVRSHSGAETLIVKLRFGDRVEDVYRFAQQHFGLATFTLMTAFPKRVLHNRHETLVEAGLTPNAVLRVNASKPG